MRLEDQCLSFDQAKKLCDLGIIQWKSYAVFIKSRANLIDTFGLFPVVNSEIDYSGFHNNKSPFEGYAAFTGTELGIMLQIPGLEMPDKLNIRADFFTTVNIETYIKPNYFRCVVIEEHQPHKIYLSALEGNNEAQARANMLILLLKKQLLHPDTVNNQLLNNH